MEILDIKIAIQIAKLIATAPNERIPLILDVFRQANVDIEGLDELSEWIALNRQATFIETEEFITGLVKDRQQVGMEYRIPTFEFNNYCNSKGVGARYARKHLYEKGYLRSGIDNGKINYTCTVVDPKTKKSIRCVCLITKGNDEKK